MLPLDRLVVETDCPYLPPQPWRGQRNEPAYLPVTAARVAELLGQPAAAVADRPRRTRPGSSGCLRCARVRGRPPGDRAPGPLAPGAPPRPGRGAQRHDGAPHESTPRASRPSSRGSTSPVSRPAGGHAADFAELLAYRSNRERARLTEAVLRAAGLPVAREPYRTVEGSGVNLFVDLGPGPRTLLLASHHDAVPGSPGANDNAAAIGILYALAVRLTQRAATPAPRASGLLRGEERAMLGSRVHVRRRDAAALARELVGVVSLELCGIGDSLALWDVTPALEQTDLVRAFVATVEALGYRRDQTYHLAEPVPFFGSDHRPFADRGVPGVGLTAIPRASIEPLRAFIYGGVRGILIRRPGVLRPSRPTTRWTTRRRRSSCPRSPPSRRRSRSWSAPSTRRSPGR